MAKTPLFLPRTVIALGVVSLLTDMSSEMIFPLLPVFVVGALRGGVASLGLIEGVAEATASLAKLASGVLADRAHRRKPLIFVGYGLAGAVRPLIGLATAWPVVLVIRFADRIGKGLRGPPRDALIADAVAADARGSAYGFHRAMDHAGAVVGPLIAFGLIAAGAEMREVFLAAAVPAALVLVIIAVFVGEQPREAAARPPALRVAELRALDRQYHRLLLALVVFALGNSTDAFLLLRLGQLGIEPEQLAVLWSLHHAVKMFAAYFGGRASDRLSRRAPLLASWVLFAAVYVAFGVVDQAAPLVGLFLVYGLTFGISEPIEKAWVADLVGPERRGVAFGWMHGAIGLAGLPASALFGALWTAAGPAAAFGTGAGLALVASTLVTRVARSP